MRGIVLGCGLWALDLRSGGFAMVVQPLRPTRCPGFLIGGVRSAIGYRRRSSTRMVAPKAFSASSKNAKWWAHQSSEPPCIITVSTAARAEQRSHRSAAVRGRAGFLSSEAFISATPPRPSGTSLTSNAVRLTAIRTPLRTDPRADLKRLLRQHHYLACRKSNIDFEQTHLRRRIALRTGSGTCGPVAHPPSCAVVGSSRSTYACSGWWQPVSYTHLRAHA